MSGFEMDEFNLLEDLDLSLLDNSYSGLVRRDENSHESGPAHTAVSLNTIVQPSPTLHPFVCSPVMDPVPGLASPNSLSFSESPQDRQYFPNANETFAVGKLTTTVTTDQTERFSGAGGAAKDHNNVAQAASSWKPRTSSTAEQ